MPRSRLTPDQIAQFHQDGYLLVRGYFTPEEIGALSRCATNDRRLDEKSQGRDDGEGGRVRLALWNHPTQTIYGAIARSETLVGCMEQLLGGEVYHYHSKMIMKDARTGGAWAWHQDYGYWYQNGVLFPDLASAFIAVDPCTRENGCLQVIRGSHRLGRIEHVLTGEQAGADLARVDEILKRLVLVYVEMAPGDLLFFHANTLHRSDQNHSDKPRWSMICCYNAAANDPYKDSHHPRYTRLDKLPDSAILDMAQRSFDGSEEDDVWMAAEEDESARALRPAAG
jgi:hypothetical protein